MTEITDLGQGVDATGRLSEAAIGRVLAACAGFVRRIDDFAPDAVCTTLTSAARDAENGATLTDGYWTLAVEGARDRLTVVGYAGDPISILDFSKPMPDGVAIVKFGSQSFYQTTALEELYLPETVEEFDWQPFAGCTSLKKVEPLLPDSVRYFNHDAFMNCPIERATCASASARRK